MRVAIITGQGGACSTITSGPDGVAFDDNGGPAGRMERAFETYRRQCCACRAAPKRAPDMDVDGFASLVDAEKPTPDEVLEYMLEHYPPGRIRRED